MRYLTIKCFQHPRPSHELLLLTNLSFCMYIQVQWVSWMKNAKSVVITPETNYSDIIVPTADTVRISFLMDMLLTNKKPVST